MRERNLFLFLLLPALRGDSLTISQTVNCKTAESSYHVLQVLTLPPKQNKRALQIYIGHRSLHRTLVSNCMAWFYAFSTEIAPLAFFQNVGFFITSINLILLLVLRSGCKCYTNATHWRAGIVSPLAVKHKPEPSSQGQQNCLLARLLLLSVFWVAKA